MLLNIQTALHILIGFIFNTAKKKFAQAWAAKLLVRMLRIYQTFMFTWFGYLFVSFRQYWHFGKNMKESMF